MKNDQVTSVELFAGIGGFRLASDNLGFSTVFANDFKPEACTVYRDQFGSDNFFEGDIRELIHKIPPHDVLTAGFPCQPFSAAGKKQGIRDPRGTLFQVIVEVLDKIKPKFFVLENVKRLLTMERGVHFATILSALADLEYQIEWRLLNAKNFGLAQNRERLVICGSRVGKKKSSYWRDSICLVTAPDISMQLGLLAGASEALWVPIERHDNRFPNWGIAANGKFMACDSEVFSEASAPVLLYEVLEQNPSPEYDFTERTLDRLASNSARNKFVQGVEILSNQDGGARMGYTIFGVNGLAPTLTASTSRHYERYRISDRFRRLTPVEYARLQGFPDSHCSVVSSYTQYELYGNAVPPPLAQWVLGKLVPMATHEKMRERDKLYA